MLWRQVSGVFSFVVCEKTVTGLWRRNWISGIAGHRAKLEFIHLKFLNSSHSASSASKLSRFICQPSPPTTLYYHLEIDVSCVPHPVLLICFALELGLYVLILESNQSNFFLPSTALGKRLWPSIIILYVLIITFQLNVESSPEISKLENPTSSNSSTSLYNDHYSSCAYFRTGFLLNILNSFVGASSPASRVHWQDHWWGLQFFRRQQYGRLV